MNAGTLIPIFGITSANTPVSPSSSGDWVPPTIAAVGSYILFTHPGFTGASGAYFGALSSFPALNTNDKGAGVTLTSSGLTFSATANNMVRCTTSVATGKYYWEVFVTSGTVLVGIATGAATLAGYLGSDATGWSYNSALKFNSGSSSAYGAAFGVGDLIGVALDLSAGTLAFTKNGVSQGVAFSGLAGTFFPAVSSGSVAAGGGIVNFGTSGFAYPIPVGFGTLAQLLTWTAQNTSGNGLVSVPTSVINFNNRAYYAVGNTLQYSDSLSPLSITNASQSLTIGDPTPITALAGLPVQTSGSGVLAALTVFKQSQIWQITGDTATSDLAENFISLSVGTQSPRSVAQAPIGTYFMSNGGPYFIDQIGGLRPLSHDVSQPDPDVQVPFQNAQFPTRWAGAYITAIYRVCGATVLLGAQSVNDYWFDEHRRRWNGPHTFPYDCASSNGSSFILSSASYPGLLLSSATSGTLTSAYNDLGTAYTCAMLTSTLPKTGDMFTHQVVESTVELGGYPVGATYAVQAQDQNGNLLAPTVTIKVPGSGGPVWGGGALWGGGGRWTSSQNRAPITYAVPWTAPLVFEKMQISIAVLAGPNVQIGAFFARYQQTGYMTMQMGA
jgi:hypothetical protein